MAAYFNYNSAADEESAMDYANRQAAADRAVQRATGDTTALAQNVDDGAPSVRQGTIRLSQNRQAVIMPAGLRPPARASAGVVQGSSAPMERVDTSQVNPRMNVPNLVMRGANGKYAVASNSQIDTNKPAVRFEDLPSTQMMRAASGQATDFKGAAQRAGEYWKNADQKALEAVQSRAQAARDQREKNRKVEEGQARRNLANAYGMALDAWKASMDKPMFGKNSDGTESQNRYIVGSLEPETVRQLNSMIAPIVGLRKGEKIVGMYAVSGVNANGDPAGAPSIIVRWRGPDGTIKKQSIPYAEAAQYVRDSMGERGDKEADWNFVQTEGERWKTFGPDGEARDVLGLSRTGHVMERQSRLDAEKAKKDLVDTQEMVARHDDDRKQAEFDEKQKVLAEARKNTGVVAAQKNLDNLMTLRANNKNPEMDAQLADQIAAAQENLNNERAKVAMDDLTKKTNENESPEGMPWLVKKNGKLTMRKEFVKIKGQDGKTRYELMRGYRQDENGNYVLEDGWTLGKEGRPVPPKKPGVPQRGQSAPNAEDNARPAQSYASEYNKRIAEFKNAGGKYSERRNGNASVRIEHYWILPKEVQNRVREYSDTLSPEVVAAQKQAKELFDASEKKYQDDRSKEEARVRDEITKRGAALGWTPQKIEETVNEELGTWEKGHWWTQAKLDKQFADDGFTWANAMGNVD